MAGRIRTIKPSFWKHEDLSELPAEVHMLAAALLNYADDEGYFNANPKLVAAECCPLREDSVSPHDALTMLSDIGYIRLFNGTDGKLYGHVVTFLDHQKINRPSPSKIKCLDSGDEPSLRIHGKLSEASLPEGKGREGNKEGKGTVSDETVVISPCENDPPECEAALEAYNEVAEQVGWPKAQKLTKQRRSSIRQRLRDAGGLEGWQDALAKAKAIPWLSGQNDRGWKANLDFFLQAKSFTKLMEGAYDGSRAEHYDIRADLGFHA